MPKYRVTITGSRVHNVAYRPFLLSVAEGFEIDRFFAKNIRKGNTGIVEALIDGDEDKIERFKEYIMENFPENASVDDIAFSDYDGHVMSVESFYRYLTASQLSKIAGTGVSLLKITEGISKKQDMMLEKQDMMLEKQDSMLEKQDMMLEKQDMMLEKQDKMLEKQDKMLEKQDSMLEKQDSLKDVVERGFRELKEEHIKTREMSMEIFRSEVQVLREEIDSLRSSVEEIRKKVGIA